MKLVLTVGALIAAPTSAQTSDAFAGMPGVVLTYYDVAGRDPAAIRASMDALRPTDANDGERVDGLTSTYLRWAWPVSGATCDLAHATVTVRATVHLPRLADRAMVAPDVGDRWDGYVAALERHEAQHVRYAIDGQKDVLAAIRAATCVTADDAAKAALAAIQERDRELDRTTDHGRDTSGNF